MRLNVVRKLAKSTHGEENSRQSDRAKVLGQLHV